MVMQMRANIALTCISYTSTGGEYKKLGFGFVQVIPKRLGRTNSLTLWNFEWVKWPISIILAIFSQKKPKEIT